MESAIRGSCLCGGVRWEFEGKVFLFNHCHCVQCRRWLAGEAQVDDPLDARPQLHLFAGEKVPWLEIADGLPAFETWPPGHGGEKR